MAFESAKKTGQGQGHGPFCRISGLEGHELEKMHLNEDLVPKVRIQRTRQK